MPSGKTAKFTQVEAMTAGYHRHLAYRIERSHSNFRDINVEGNDSLIYF